MVDRQPVGRQDVGAHDDPHVLPGQSGPHDAGLLLVPVGPEHQTETDRGARGSVSGRRCDQIPTATRSLMTGRNVH